MLLPTHLHNRQCHINAQTFRPHSSWLKKLGISYGWMWWYVYLWCWCFVVSRCRTFSKCLPKDPLLPLFIPFDCNHCIHHQHHHDNIHSNSFIHSLTHSFNSLANALLLFCCFDTALNSLGYCQTSLLCSFSSDL